MNPFGTIKEFFKSRLSDLNKTELSDSFFNYFSKQRAKYQYSKKFYKGYEILENSYISACNKYCVLPDLSAFEKLLDYLFSSPEPYDDALYTVEKLRKRYIIGLITNADNCYLYKSLRNNGFKFNFIITSEDSQVNKPDEAIFRKALEYAGEPPQNILMVGDSLSEDIIPCRNVGINAVLIDRKSISENQPSQIKENSLNDSEIKSLKDLFLFLPYEKL